MTDKFKEFTARNYSDQGKAFLNAYLADIGEPEANKVWDWCIKFADLDLAKKKEGTDLDEFNAHRFLESLNESKTVRQMRQEIAESDLDFNKRLALIEYCLWRYKKAVPDFLKRPQGGSEEIRRCQQRIKEITVAIEELKVAQKQLKAQEDAHNKAIATLKKKIRCSRIGNGSKK